ncbi:MAG: proton-conducting transporter membrane subunit [Pseudomonadota bacterium]
MIEALMLLPLATGILCFFLRPALGRVLLVLTAWSHLGLTVAVWWAQPAALWPDYFALSSEGLLSLGVISLLFALIAMYTRVFLPREKLEAENIFLGAMLLFLSTMTMVTLSDHLMVMWIAIEATTLASAPLIYSHRTPGALEATWKYVLICSVGIAMALLGSVLVSVAMDAGQVQAALTFSDLSAHAAGLDPTWLKASFVFVLVGYGTKMGLAPMHTWLPDAHSEAPSPASALLSGVLLNCAYLGIFKTSRILYAAGLGDFAGNVLIAFGLISMLAAATFIVRQTEIKRLLAYSSIENMGLIAIGTGIGGLGVYGAMLCLIHHSLIKSSLFLCSGHILLGVGSGRIDGVGALIRRMPRTAITFLAGFVGIGGLPPFGLFLGELFIVLAAIRAGRYAVVAVLVLCLTVAMAGFVRHVLRMAFADAGSSEPVPESLGLVWPQLALLATSLLLLFWMPETLSQTIQSAIATMGGVAR